MQKALQSLPGVAQVDVNVSAGTATLQVDPSQFDADKAVAALADAGFSNSSLKQ